MAPGARKSTSQRTAKNFFLLLLGSCCTAAVRGGHWPAFPDLQPCLVSSLFDTWPASDLHQLVQSELSSPSCGLERLDFASPAHRARAFGLLQRGVPFVLVGLPGVAAASQRLAAPGGLSNLLCCGVFEVQGARGQPLGKIAYWEDWSIHGGPPLPGYVALSFYTRMSYAAFREASAAASTARARRGRRRRGNNDFMVSGGVAGGGERGTFLQLTARSVAAADRSTPLSTALKLQALVPGLCSSATEPHHDDADDHLAVDAARLLSFRSARTTTATMANATAVVGDPLLRRVARPRAAADREGDGPSTCTRPVILKVHPRGVSLSAHYDESDNVIMQLTGSRRWLLMPPTECSKACLYGDPHPESRHSAVPDWGQPNYALFPAFAAATAVQAVLQPAETLMLPAGWIHWAISLEGGAQLNSPTDLTAGSDPAVVKEGESALERCQTEWKNHDMGAVMGPLLVRHDPCPAQ